MATTEVMLDDLHLDLNNPRFDGLASQRDALEKIVTNQGNKLVNLAEDIVENGLSPAHRMLVMKGKGKGKGEQWLRRARREQAPRRAARAGQSGRARRHAQRW